MLLIRVGRRVKPSTVDVAVGASSTVGGTLNLLGEDGAHSGGDVRLSAGQAASGIGGNVVVLSDEAGGSVIVQASGQVNTSASIVSIECGQSVDVVSEKEMKLRAVDV
ncbi:unnamed protein product [Aphanomyces euteiches]